MIAVRRRLELTAKKSKSKFVTFVMHHDYFDVVFEVRSTIIPKEGSA